MAFKNFITLDGSYRPKGGNPGEHIYIYPFAKRFSKFPLGVSTNPGGGYNILSKGRF